jgi:hypothetical protein
MALNKGLINPLNVLGLRKLSFIPDHFSKIAIGHKIDLKEIEQWIEYNLNSRYCIQSKLDLDENRKIVGVLYIGIEDPKELTMLSLGYQNLYRKDF